MLDYSILHIYYMGNTQIFQHYFTAVYQNLQRIIFDYIMRLMSPDESGWTGLTYCHNMYLGWYEESPWAIDDLQMALKQFESALNGEWFLEFTIFANRTNPQTEQVFKLYKRTGELAEGSYRLIYLYEDAADSKE